MRVLLLPLVLCLIVCLCNGRVPSTRYGEDGLLKNSSPSSSSSSTSSSSIKTVLNKLASLLKDGVNKKKNITSTGNLLDTTSQDDAEDEITAPILIADSANYKQQQQQQQQQQHIPLEMMDVPMSPTNDEEDKEDEKLILILKETTNTNYNQKNDEKKKKHSFDGVFVHKVNKQPVIETTSKEEDPLKTIYLMDKGGYYNAEQKRTTIIFEIDHSFEPERIRNIELAVRVFQTTTLNRIYVTDKNQTFKKQLRRNIFDIRSTTRKTKWLHIDFCNEIIEELKSNPRRVFLCVEMTSLNREISSIQRKDSYLKLQIKRLKKRTRRERASQCRKHTRKISFEELGIKVVYPVWLKTIDVDYCAGSCSDDPGIRGKEKCCVASRMDKGTTVLISGKNRPQNHAREVDLHTHALACECR